MSVVLVDVDHFKRVNDTLGHEAGDRILTAVADLLRTQVRNGDAACRYGGEEFVVVLPGTRVEVAAARADRWRKELASSAPVAGVEAVTISVGVAAAPAHGTTGSELLRAADEAMYAAKAAGRDQVVVAETGEVLKTWLSS